MTIKHIRDFATKRGISLPSSEEVLYEAGDNVAKQFNFSLDELKSNVDRLVEADENEAHKVYKRHEREYVNQVLDELVAHLVNTGEISCIEEVGRALKAHSRLLDEFYVSLANGRKSRAGLAFGGFNITLFKRLKYPIVVKPKIDGKPDFVLPSKNRYEENASDCITFTSKRTLRERWKQVVTGQQTFLATIDKDLTRRNLREMQRKNVTVICPLDIQQRLYRNESNVISFQEFFRDYLDPAMKKWNESGEFGMFGVLNGDVR